MKTTHALIPLLLFTLLVLFTRSPIFGQALQAPARDSLQPLYLAGVSPVILGKDQVEVSFVHSLTSFWLASLESAPDFSPSGTVNRYRFTNFDQLLRVSYGFGHSGRWDLGAVLQYRHRRLDDEANSSPFRVFQGDDHPAFSQTDRGLALAGARLRVMPFAAVPELTLQSSVAFPVAKDEALRRDLGADRTQADLFATFYKPFNPRTYYFLQAGWLTQFANPENDRTTHQVSGSGFLVQSLFDYKVYLYPGLTYAASLQGGRNQSGLRRINQQLLGGLGVQYQPWRVLAFSLYGQLPFILDSGSSATEWVRESYVSWTLGIRAIF